MNQGSGVTIRPHIQPIEGQPIEGQPIEGQVNKASAIDPLLASAQVSESLIPSFRQAWVVNSFRLGDLIYVDNTPSPDQNSATGEHSACYFVAEGRVRLLCADAGQRESSALVLQAGAIFGGDQQFCETPLPYQAIAPAPEK
ncbi:MAG: hypothetical protein HC780_12035, partial [Leptolyngbyaceae cyanobacterium CSU_1_3]|nr:hypothetical protein [Leptolyngbyaceae cyanobacterium CSU_1_3]